MSRLSVVGAPITGWLGWATDIVTMLAGDLAKGWTGPTNLRWKGEAATRLHFFLFFSLFLFGKEQIVSVQICSLYLRDISLNLINKMPEFFTSQFYLKNYYLLVFYKKQIEM